MKGTSYLALASAALWATGLHAQNVYDLPSNGPPLSETGVGSALKLVRSYALPIQTAEEALLAAAQSRDPACTGLLKEIVAAYEPPETVGFLALHALWEVGEPPAYFFDLASSPETSDGLAYYALWVAARAPTHQGLVRARAAAQGREGRVADAVSEYADLLSWEKEVEAMPVTEQIPSLYDEIVSSFTSFLSSEEVVQLSPGRPDGDLQPGAVMARSLLRSLAATDPVAVRSRMAMEPVPPQFLGMFGDNAGPVGRWFREYMDASAFPRDAAASASGSCQPPPR